MLRQAGLRSGRSGAYRYYAWNGLFFLGIRHLQIDSRTERCILRRLLTGAAFTLGLGVLYALSPASVESAAGIQLPTAAALTEIRSTYGGLHIGLGLFLVACSMTPTGRPFGLLLCALAFSFAGVMRIWGVAQFGSGLPQLATSALELGFSGGAFLLWRRTQAA